MALPQLLTKRQTWTAVTLCLAALLVGAWVGRRQVARQCMRWGIGIGYGESQRVAEPTTREKVLLGRVAKAFDMDYPFLESDGVVVWRTVLTGWAARMQPEEESYCHLNFHIPKGTHAGRYVSVHAWPDLRIFDLSSGDKSSTGSLGGGQPRAWLDLSAEARAQLDSRLASATLALCGTGLRFSDADDLDFSDGRILSSWYRRKDGVRFEDDRYYANYDVRGQALGLFLDDNDSRATGESTPAIAAANAERIALVKTESFDCHGHIEKPIGKQGYSIRHVSTDLRFVTPAEHWGSAWSRRVFGDSDEARLAYLVIHEIEPPSSIVRGAAGRVSVWVDAMTGEVLCWDDAVGIRIR